MQSPQAHLKQIRRILALWPSQAADDGDELLRAYVLAVEDYPADDVERAVDMLVKGVAPGVSPGYRPKPPEVGAECRRQNQLSADRLAREKALRPQLPPPEIPRTPEAQARVKALLETTVERLSPPEARPRERHRLMLTRANERFDVGDPDGDAAA